MIRGSSNQQTNASADHGPPPGRIRARAIIIALLLLPLNAWWLAQIEYVRYSDNVTTSALFFNCVVVLLLLVAMNRLLIWLAPRWRFTRAEMLCIYIVLVVGSALAGHDQLQILFTTITWVFRNATPENGWADALHPHLPGHLVMSNPSALEKIYSGDASIYASGNLIPWLEPLGWWVGFTCVLVWTLYCLMSLFRKQWDYERLNYPIAGVPLEITEPRAGLFASPLFWVAFAVGALVQIVRLLHNVWPAVPNLNVGVHLYRFPSMPLRAAGAIPISSYPFSYGMAYLLPVQLAFSVWFFFFFSRLQMVTAAAFGHSPWRGFPYIQQQGMGAYIGVALFVIWAARGHLRDMWRAAIGAQPGDSIAGGAEPEATPDTERAEPLPPPVAVWGAVAGIVGLLSFSVIAGMSLTAAVCFFAVFLLTVLTITRIRAELGLPTIELYQVGVDDLLQKVAGGAAFSPKDLTVMTLYFWLTRTHRQLPMPVHADAMRIGHEAGANMRKISWIVLGGSALGAIFAFWALLHVMYQTGYETAVFTGPADWAFGRAPWTKLDSWLANPVQPQYGASAAYLVGMAFTMFLVFMRTRFTWWPFHPIGYLVLGSFGLFRLWLPILVTWSIKTALLHYGGLSAFRNGRPFFIGLIVGEFSAGFTRTIVDLILNLHLPPESGIGGL